MSRTLWWRLPHRPGPLLRWLVPAALALGMTAPGVAGAQGQRVPSRILDGTVFGPMVPLAQGVARSDSVQRLLAHFQLASIAGEPGTIAGVLIGGSRLWVTLTREVGLAEKESTPLLASFGVGGRLAIPRPIGTSPTVIRVFVDGETNITTVEGARRLSVGLRLPASAALRAGDFDLGVFAAPGFGFERLFIETCEDSGSGDGCGSLGLRPAVSGLRMLVGGGISVRHVISGLAVQAGIQQPVFHAQRPTLAVGLSIAR